MSTTIAMPPLSRVPVETFDPAPGPSRAAAPERLRVLVSAYAVSPARGSEPGMGWNICSRLAAHHDVTVLCSPQVPPHAQDFRAEITQRLRESGPIPGLCFEFVEPPLLSYLFQRETPLMRRTLYYIGYRAWQRAALQRARALHAEQPFDLVHQLNITGFREPGYLWKLPAPFVWGPIGGAANVPPAYLPLMGLRERMFYRLRSLMNASQQRRLTRCRKAAARASHIWTIGEANRRLVADTWGRPAQPLLEVGATAEPHAAVKHYQPGRALRLVWSGQHLGRKALPILLQALAGLRNVLHVELTVLGQGHETGRWKALACALGIDHCVRWTGYLPRADALREMAAADAFVSTSVLEETSLVVLEALSLGLPVVCHDAFGMGVAVDESCGIKISMKDPATSVAGFAAALSKLATAGEIHRLSGGALRRAAELSWDSKAHEIAHTYTRVAARCGRGGDL